MDARTSIRVLLISSISAIAAVTVLGAGQGARPGSRDDPAPSTAVVRGFASKTLSNGELELLVMLPDSRAGYYRGVRFDPSGIVAQATWRGHTFFQGTEKTTSSRGTGTIEEWRTPLGYGQAAPGESFLKVAVGVLERANTEPYHHSGSYKVVDRGQWNVAHGPGWIEFRQELATDFGYAYTYRKRITLASNSPEFTVDHEFTNTGSREIRTDTYSHNYIRFDERPVGPDYTADFGPGLELPDKRPAFFHLENTALRPTHELPDGETHGIALQARPDVTVSNRATGTSVRITGNRPLSSLYFYCWRGAMCPEPYIDIHLKPGDTATWRNQYTFQLK